MRVEGAQRHIDAAAYGQPQKGGHESTETDHTPTSETGGKELPTDERGRSDNRPANHPG